MKKTIYALLIICLSISVNAKELKPSKIPKELKNTVAMLYPKALKLSWSKEGSKYEAEFINAGVKISLDLDNKGNVLATETAIQKSDLPNGVIEYIEKNFKGFEITETTKIIDSAGLISYEAEVSKGHTVKDLIFDKDGRLIKK
jgi:hypothetical protein